MKLVILAALLLSPLARATDCKLCEEWNVSQKPFKIFGNTYYVGVRGLTTLLISSPEGHVLIDGGLAESAPKIAQNIRELGLRLEDVKLILNSHAHFDHAGGISKLQSLTGAKVMASSSSAKILKSGQSGPDDPQFGELLPIEPISEIETISDGETLQVGSLSLRAHQTPGHTRGGTTWTWKSCENKRCLNVVYADSLSAVSAKGFRFTDSPNYPDARQDFEKSFKLLRSLPCDILITPHPERVDLWTKLERRNFEDKAACLSYADRAQANFLNRLAKEAADGTL